jgi:ankyrin repeat protein
MNRSLPTRKLRPHPDLDQLKRQAKELLAGFAAGEHAAVAEVNAHCRGADAPAFALNDAQLVIARAYGFDSWPKLKAFVDGVTMNRLTAAVQSGDIERVRALVGRRPELAAMSIDNIGPLIHAVLRREPEMVRLLASHGANPREGVYPHRDATSPLAIATDRGYAEIVAVLMAEEEGPGRGGTGSARPGRADELFRAIVGGDSERAMAMVEAEPELIPSTTAEGLTPLHGAAWTLREPLVAWLLDRGADPNRKGPHDATPLDAAASGTWRGQQSGLGRRFRSVAAQLEKMGATMTARAAVARGDGEWIRRRHAAGGLPGPIDGIGGLLRVAVTHDQLAMLSLLLELGLDPDERVRVPGTDEVEYSWGFPLWECAATGKHAMAEILLRRGADPNAAVYASGSPVSEAYGQGDEKMILLLERYGGSGDAGLAALYRRTDLAKRFLAEAPDKRKVAEALVGAGACGGDAEIVRIALEQIDMPRDDPRWFSTLEQPLRVWNHGPGHWCRPEWDRESYLTCFGMLLERADPNLRGRPQDKGQFGLTILHSVAGSRPHVTAEERIRFATMLIDAGARLDLRDNLLGSTPLGWSCRWGRTELVKLLLDRGADPFEDDAESWATPRAWAEKKGHNEILSLLKARGA